MPLAKNLNLVFIKTYPSIIEFWGCCMLWAMPQQALLPKIVLMWFSITVQQ